MYYISFFFKKKAKAKNFRSLYEKDPSSQQVHKYAKNTTSGNLKNHLRKHHIAEWVGECERLGIQIQGKDALADVANYKGLPVQDQAEAHMPFSKDNFLDAIVEFIVVTNQVFYLIV